ncbi:MAG: GNAT family protein [Pseudomonadota bacterium]
MQGRYVRLEPLTVEHAAALHAANSMDTEQRIWQWLPYGPYPSAEAYADWVGAMTLDRDPLFYAIVVEGRPIGIASYLRIAPAAGSIEVGHINFSPRLQRTPAATEAMFLMMQWAFEAGYRRYEWKCNALNAGSRAAAQRYGLSYEGVFRQATVSKGRNRDTAWYAAIDREWPALRSAFETWLEPANFDAEGRQRQRLSDLTRPILEVTG